MAFITIYFWFTKDDTFIYRDPAIVWNYLLEYNKIFTRSKVQARGALYVFVSRIC